MSEKLKALKEQSKLRKEELAKTVRNSNIVIDLPLV